MADHPITTKTFTLNQGDKFPAVGLGTWQGSHGSDDSKALEESIIHSLKSGYRLIDTAQSYGVENIVGRAIRASGVPREEITVVTKFWGHWHHDPAEALRISLADLGLDYVDVFLMHWPWATTPAPEKKPLGKYESPTFIETWLAMEKLVGPKCRAIGVSNFTEKLLEELREHETIVPAINQVELHAFNPNLKLVPYCQSRGIHVTSWSTLGGQRDGENLILSHQLFSDIAKAHGCSTGVVSLSWAVQRGITVIPKSKSKARIEENIKLVTLSAEEVDKINRAQDTIKRQRLSNDIASMHIKIDGKTTFQKWTYQEVGWEDENGQWLTPGGDSIAALSTASSGRLQTAELSHTRHPSSYDRHETHEPTTSLEYQQRQQPTPLQQQRVTTPDPEGFPSPGSSHRLRRTPKFEATPSPRTRQAHIANTLAALSSQHSRQRGNPAPSNPEKKEPDLRPAARERSTRHRTRRVLSQELGEDPDEQSSELSPSQDPQASQDPYPVHPVVRITKHTHSAILFTLEEALRQPNQFTPDLEEESASMADLMSSGGAPITSNGGSLPAPQRPTASPNPRGSPGIRGPRMIMQERAAREAARVQRAEAEKQLEQETRQREEAQRSADHRSAGVAHGPSGKLPAQHPSTTHRGHAVHESSPPSRAEPTTPQQVASHQRTNTSRYAANQQLPSQYQSHHQHAPQQQQRPTTAGQAGESSTQTGGTSGSSKPRNSFPHAFERWETLSAHWEGLTSYWIHKLEQNKDAVNRDPINQQLSRQVTDLSAAGANLFHAVVELQRLRASSERKFQRWFFETRAELERAQEVNSMLENALDQERRNRDEAIREAVEKEQGSSLAQKQLAEMRKELAISKDEARRAWEELGRREQGERERLLSLQTGQPTIVGGVQVVPMTHGLRDQAAQQAEYSQSYHGSQTNVAQSSAASAGPSGAQYGQAEAGSQSARGHYRATSEGGTSDNEFVKDVKGVPLLDVHGNKIPVAAPPSTYSGSEVEQEEYDTPATTNPPSGSYDPPSTSGPTPQWTGAYSNPQDYAGEEYGAPGWETVPRHHHPTRLSDVIEEEEERSRTTASQVSRGI
ncbi:unnamed protein product [Clonostachys chloroleuca]|uniref:NADP-dependent oxidoreductase domain-containing protein n=1 Tax=Clonostachys chloroleuca TaxID=1926264 RepID=A0AA35MGD2_9HYPO|nr:unnamed protein product [Clonostachys chloroleuca]